MDKTEVVEPRLSERIRIYWESHPLGIQFLQVDDLEVGSDEFFEHIQPQMTARFPWILELIHSQGPKLRGKHLLEIGCGMGFDTLEWLNQGVSVTAIDISEIAVGLAQRNLRRLGLSADLYSASALELPFPDASFDVVYSRGVLHHTGDTQAAVDEVWRVLRPGGMAYICHLYRRYSWMYFLSKLGREPIEFVDGDPPVTKFHTVPEVCDMFDQFEISEVHLHHTRAFETLRTGVKATLYNKMFRPIYNRLPEALVNPLAFKISIHAKK